MKSFQELDHAYRKAWYRVCVNQQWHELLIDQAAPKILPQNWCWITAHNPGSRILSVEENRIRTANLEQNIKQSGCNYYSAESGSRDGLWPAETGFVVIGMDEKTMLNLIISYQQQAILECQSGMVRLRHLT